ncbi:MAG: hypothetical protein IT459_02790 [Planctomycetes bacterium]|nr:hypothetical protein [Planctomycetota bacterium]
MRRVLQVVAVLGLAVAAWYVATTVAERGERAESYQSAIAYGSDLERAAEPARAALVYEQALDLELTDEQVVELKFRRARSLIEANDLNTALGLVQDLLGQEPVAHSIDLGPLLMQLGRRAKERGDATLAKVAFRLGQASSPQRYAEFGRELEAFIRPLPPDSPGASK